MKRTWKFISSLGYIYMEVDNHDSVISSLAVDGLKIDYPVKKTVKFYNYFL